MFECDLNRVLAHRKQQRRQNVELLLTSYYLVACCEALKLVPELLPASGNGPSMHLGVIFSTADGATLAVRLDAQGNGMSDPSAGSVRTVVHYQARDFGPRLFTYFEGWGSIALPGKFDWFDHYWWIPIVGPLIGPALDRMPGGRRLLVCVTGLGRFVLCLLMARHVVDYRAPVVLHGQIG